MSKAKFVINMEDGTVSFRTEMSDKLPLTFHLIDDATAEAVGKGAVKASDVIEAIKKGFMSKSDFSWDNYDKMRRAEKDLRNVSQRDMRPDGEVPENENQPDKPEEVATLASLGLGNAAKAEGKPKPAVASKKETAAKPAASAVAEALGNY